MDPKDIGSVWETELEAAAKLIYSELESVLFGDTDQPIPWAFLPDLTQERFVRTALAVRNQLVGEGVR